MREINNLFKHIVSLIQKCIRPSLQYIDSLFTGDIDSLIDFPIPVKDAHLVDQERGVAIDCSAFARKLWSMDRFGLIPKFSFIKEGEEFIVPTNTAFVNSNGTLSADEYQSALISINRFYSAGINWEDKHYLRSVQPLERFDWSHTFHTYGYEEKFPGGGFYSSIGLMEVNFDGKGIFQIYPYRLSNQYYLICEAHFQTTIQEFNELAYAAQLSLGLFTDRVVLDESYTLCYEDNTFSTPKGVYYMEMRPSIKGNYPIFSTSMYWLHEALKGGTNNSYADAVIAPGGVVDNGIVDWLPMDFYSGMVNEVYNHEPLRRAISIILDASTEPVEYQAALYSVALECLTSFLLAESGIQSTLPVDKNVYSKEIKPEFESILKQKKSEGKISDEGMRILGNRLNNLNGVTNSGKLTDPFSHFGYTLTKIDKDTINVRNRLLHGGILSGVNYAVQFDKLYQCCIRLHKLCCILLLKRVGFTSRIVNLPVLRDFADECAAQEPLLLQL